MTRALACILALGLALPSSARAEVPPTTEGRSVDIEAGQPAPFKGALVDDAYALTIRNRRRAAELAAEDAIARATTSAGELAECRAGESGWRPATVAALVAAALAIGVVGGVYLGATAAR